MRFDWYSATITDRPDTVVQVLRENLGGDDVTESHGLHGYQKTFEIRRGGGTIARVLAGGVNPEPNAFATGSDADHFVGVVRSSFRGLHHVARFDSCEDFDSVGAWDRLYDGALLGATFGRTIPLKTQLISSPTDSNGGRTLYVGSPKSPCRVRIYEKGKQMASEFPARAGEFSKNWVRIEAQIRPHDEARVTAATASPEEAWGFSQTTRRIGARCLSLSVPKVGLPSHHAKNDESSMDWIAMQHEKLFNRQRMVALSAADFTQKLFKRIEKVKIARLRIA